MKKALVPAIFLAALAAIGWAVNEYGLRWSEDRDFADGATLPDAAPALRPGQKITFLELGSVGCRPCDAMRPVMEAVTRKHGDRVDVRFHDVREDPAMAGKYRIRLIPTQVFLLPDGTEFFRHEGYFAEQEVVALLRRMGVR